MAGSATPPTSARRAAPTRALRLAPAADGFTVEARDLGPLLGLDPADVQGLMRNGAITSRFERGEGTDAGRFRLSFFHDRRRLTLVVDAAGTVLSSATVTAAVPPARPASPGRQDR